MGQRQFYDSRTYILDLVRCMVDQEGHFFSRKISYDPSDPCKWIIGDTEVPLNPEKHTAWVDHEFYCDLSTIPSLTCVPYHHIVIQTLFSSFVSSTKLKPRVNSDI